MLRVAWPIISDLITDLYEKCLMTAQFPTCWKNAKLVIIPKGKGKDPLLTGSYRPISLLPTLGKALESLIASRLEKETSLNEIGQQHGYVSGRSTETAVKALYTWTDQCPNKIVIGAFLDITGAFDYVRWSPIFEQLKTLKISDRTLRLLESYLTNRQATLTVDNETRTRKMTRGCPQGSRLGPTLWKVAMSDAFKTSGPQSHIIAYADDIALAVGGAKLDTIKKILINNLDHLTCWSKKFGLEFSMAKSQLMTLKGGVKPTYTVPFGSSADAIMIRASKMVKYLGVTIDPRRSFWEHVLSISDKSTDMFKRLRSMTSANWGVDQSTSMVIYKAVFLPRITYAGSIWQNALKLKCSITKLGSSQRQALLAITSAYKTTSTAALQVLSGQLPLDLEVRRLVLRRSLKTNVITYIKYEQGLLNLLEIWQDRWSSQDKGEWTLRLIPDIRVRYGLPLKMDHYTSQMITGHGDFRGKLHSFKLVPAPGCACGNGSETVMHVLLACPRTEIQRENLKRKLREESVPWPPYHGAILKNKKTYEAFRTFARESLKQRSDR